MKVVITGAGAGLGLAIKEALLGSEFSPGFSKVTVVPVDRKLGHDVRNPEGQSHFKVSATKRFPEVDKLDVLINCAAINRIDWFGDVTDDLWDETLDINAKGILKATQFYLKALSAEAHSPPGAGEGRKGGGGTVLNIVSNASHMPMRCSLAYNASKGAAHIMTLQMARELYGTHGITVFGISPNKLKGTEMSDDIDQQVVATRGWTVEQAQAYQLQGLATQTETDPATLAEFIAFLLSSKQRHRFLHGNIIPYGA